MSVSLSVNGVHVGPVPQQTRQDREITVAYGPGGEDYAVLICEVGIGTSLKQSLDCLGASPADGECERRHRLRLLWVWPQAAGQQRSQAIQVTIVDGAR